MHVSRPDSTAAAVPRDQPRLMLDTLFIDKGDIPVTAPMQTVEFVYPIRNAGGAELQIKKIHPNCSCVVAKEPAQAIPPGGVDSITLRYTIDSRKSAFLHEALVETNDPAQPAVVLRAGGNTDALVFTFPSTLDLGNIAFGQHRRAFLLIRYSGEEDFTLHLAGSSVPGVALTIKETKERAVTDLFWPRSHGRIELGKSARVLEVGVTAVGEQPCDLTGEITLGTNISRFEKITVPVTGKLVPPVAASPSLLSFGELGPEERAERSLALVSLVNRPFRVVGVGPEGAGLQWSITKNTEEGKSVQVQLSGMGAAIHKLNGSSIALTIESEGKKFDLKVPVFAWKMAEPSGSTDE